MLPSVTTCFLSLTRTSRPETVDKSPGFLSCKFCKLQTNKQVTTHTYYLEHMMERLCVITVTLCKS